MNPTTPTPTPTPSDGGELLPFLESAQGMLQGWGGALIIMLGAIGLIWGGVLLIKKLLAPDGYYGPSWASIAMLIIVGGALSSGGFGLMSSQPSESDAKSGPPTGLDGKGGASPAPLPEATTTPSPEPKSDPISLPEVSNPEVLWTWIAVAAAVVALLVVLYFFLRKVRRDRLRAIEEANEKAKAEAEAQRLAEEEAAREKARREEQERIEARWATITDLHAHLRRKVADAETDWDTLFDLPALSDVSFRQTRALHRAMREAENAVAPMPVGFDEQSPMDRIPYVKKVHAFQDAWESALINARKVGTSKLPAEELRTIKRIRGLLRLAEGNGATENERQTAYAQIRRLLEDLRVVQLPERVVLAVEAGKRLALTAAPTKAAEPLRATAAGAGSTTRRARREKEPFRL